MVTVNRITPEWVERLAENEIFVFGCRNSGRHFDGASNFALENLVLLWGSVKVVKGNHTPFPLLVE